MMELFLAGEKAAAKALCVSIKHIIVMISRLKKSPLVWTRQRSLGAS